MREYRIEINDADQRLDRFLIKLLPNASSSFLQKMIRQKRIKINKKKAEASSMLSEGDQVQIYIYEEKLALLERKAGRFRSDIRVSYAFENKDLAIIDKPAGLLCHAVGPQDYGNNLVDAYLADLIDRGEYIPRLEKTFRPALVNRLDFNTQGLLIASKSHKASMVLSEAVQDDRIEKSYLAYVQGRVAFAKDGKSIFIDEPLLTVNGHSFVDPKGKKALTEISCLSYEDGISLLEVKLHSGRTHQIRAHLSYIGHPLLFDKQYGGIKNRKFQHYQLLSYKMTFHSLEEVGLSGAFEVVSARKEGFLNLRKDLKSAII